MAFVDTHAAELLRRHEVLSYLAAEGPLIEDRIELLDSWMSAHAVRAPRRRVSGGNGRGSSGGSTRRTLCFAPTGHRSGSRPPPDPAPGPPHLDAEPAALAPEPGTRRSSSPFGRRPGWHPENKRCPTPERPGYLGRRPTGHSLRRLCPRWRTALTLVQPATVVKWHGRGFRSLWRRETRPRGGRPRFDFSPPGSSGCL